MGVHKNVGMNRFPKQGERLGKRVIVCFDYDTTKTIGAVCIRDDIMEEPYLTLFRLDDGRVVTATECHYQFSTEGDPVGIDPDKLSPSVRKAIANNLDVPPDSPDFRTACAAMEPSQAFERFCTWNGLINWGATLAQALDNIRAAATGERG